MLLGEEIKVDKYLNYADTIKNLTAESKPGTEAIKKYTGSPITVISVATIHNRKRENLQFHK